jgi:molecular chaperone GrpE
MTDKENNQNEKENELEILKQKCDEYLNNWKRERADFINYKKDEAEKIGIFAGYIKEDMILKVLPILDSFNLAEKHLPEDKESIQGFLQIKKQLEDFLSKEGIEEIKTNGQKFDPAFMEAVGADEGISGYPDSAESGMVVEEIQKGYILQGKVLRPAKVKISK